MLLVILWVLEASMLQVLLALLERNVATQTDMVESW
jgi:hypothetical protein